VIRFALFEGKKQLQRRNAGVLTDTEVQADSLQVIDVAAIHSAVR